MGIQVDAPARAEGTTERVSSNRGRSVGMLKRNEQLVYDALCKSKTPLKAYELLENLQEYGLRAPMTIYRALDALIAKGCVKKIASLNAFIAIRPGRASNASAILICRDCLKVKLITLEEQQVTQLFMQLPISSTDVCIEAFGDCHMVCEKHS